VWCWQHSAVCSDNHVPPTRSAPQTSTTEQLQLYAHFKQVTVGDCNVGRPSFFYMTERAKWYVHWSTTVVVVVCAVLVRLQSTRPRSLSWFLLHWREDSWCDRIAFFWVDYVCGHGLWFDAIGHPNCVQLQHLFQHLMWVPVPPAVRVCVWTGTLGTE
jgi:hypothetical protein